MPWVFGIGTFLALPRLQTAKFAAGAFITAALNSYRCPVVPITRLLAVV